MTLVSVGNKLDLPSAKAGMLWTDYILIGGSDHTQAAGSVMVIQCAGSANTPEISGGRLLNIDTITALGSGLTVNSYYPNWGSTGSGTASKVQHLVQAGSGATGTGSTAWWVFPTAFSGVPAVHVTAQAATDDTENVTTGSIAAGSFEAFSTSASVVFSWIAVGTI